MGSKSWEMADSTWDPNDASVVWIGSMMGPYRSSDGGANWVESERDSRPSTAARIRPVEKILYDPDQPGRLLAFGGTSRRWQTTDVSQIGVVWESLDSGESSRKLTVITKEGSQEAPRRGLNIVAAAYLGRSGQKLICLADGGGVFVSQDDGRDLANVQTAECPRRV